MVVADPDPNVMHSTVQCLTNICKWQKIKMTIKGLSRTDISSVISPPQKNEKLNISIDDLALSAVLIYSTCSLAAELTVVHWSKKFRWMNVWSPIWIFFTSWVLHVTAVTSEANEKRGGAWLIRNLDRQIIKKKYNGYGYGYICKKKKMGGGA